MKKYFLLLGVIILIGIILFLLMNFKKDETLYYTYEGKFVMSSIANRVKDYKNLNNNYFIKEKVNNVKSDSKIIEVIYDEYSEKPIVYGYYKESDFNKYFKRYIDEGLKCDSDSGYNMGEGVILRCTVHDNGFEYQEKDSQVCTNINDNIICIKPNDWKNIDNYKKSFEDSGWTCEYTNYNLKCIESKDNNGMEYSYCTISSEGSAICSNNIGWCGIGSDLNTWCFGTN